MMISDDLKHIPFYDNFHKQIIHFHTIANIFYSKSFIHLEAIWVSLYKEDNANDHQMRRGDHNFRRVNRGDNGVQGS